jgi:hypothetical protein
VIFNRDEFYVPAPPYLVMWKIRPTSEMGSAGPFDDLYPALRVKITLGEFLRHDGKWQWLTISDARDTVIAGYSRLVGDWLVAVPPRALKPARFDTADEEMAYDRWAAMMTRTADHLALAPYEQEQL